jgi:hypothetical protein
VGASPADRVALDVLLAVGLPHDPGDHRDRLGAFSPAPAAAERSPLTTSCQYRQVAPP